MDKKSINQNETIQDGLEKFLDRQVIGIDVIPVNKTPQTQGAYVGNTASGMYGYDAGVLDSQEDIKDFGEDHYNNYDMTAAKRKSASGQRQTGGHSAGRAEHAAGDGRTDAAYKKGTSGNMANSKTSHKTNDKSNSKTSGNKKGSTRKNDTENAVKNNKNRNGGNKKNNGKKGNGGDGSAEKKKHSKLKKVLFILLIVFLALFLWWYFMVGRVYNKMTYEKADDIIEGPMKEEGVINILLIGNDSRESGDDGRSDAMILVSVSSKTKKIYMTSLLRDMYVEIPGHDANRLNAAYAYGGAALLCETIEQNFDIQVNRYALVNFQAFASVVDAVGGVDLELTNEEVQWVNAYLNEYNLLEGREMTTDYLDPSLSGMLHLNGPQALAYCRNRYIGTDFGRTERQRKVLTAVSKKLPMAMASNSGELIDGLFPNLTTNLTQTEVYQLTLNMAKYLAYDVEQMAIPAEGTYSNATIRQMMVLQVDFEANKKILREKIYGEESSGQDVTGDVSQ